MSETQQIAPELHSAVPRLEGEGGAPHQPEVCREKFRIELLSDARPAQHGLGFQRQSLECQDISLAKAERGRGFPVPGSKQARLGGRLEGFVPVDDLLRDRLASIESRDRGKQVESAEIFALDHASAAQHIPGLRRAGTVQATADLIEFL